MRLYGRGAVFTDDLVRMIVARTENVSAAFIKELMRRSVQFQLERDGAQDIQPCDVENALEEMLFSGGSVNLKLLGGNSGRIGFKSSARSHDKYRIEGRIADVELGSSRTGVCGPRDCLRTCSCADDPTVSIG